MGTTQIRRQGYPVRITGRGHQQCVLVFLALFPAAPAPAEPTPPAGPCALPLPDLYKRVSPAVVSITTASINPYDTASPIERRAGSGVIVDAAGLILTNSHLVFGQQLVTVTLDDGTALPARIVGADPVFDIAFLKVPPPAGGPLPVTRLGTRTRCALATRPMRSGTRSASNRP